MNQPKTHLSNAAPGGLLLRAALIALVAGPLAAAPLTVSPPTATPPATAISAPLGAPVAAAVNRGRSKGVKAKKSSTKRPNALRRLISKIRGRKSNATSSPTPTATLPLANPISGVRAPQTRGATATGSVGMTPRRDAGAATGAGNGSRFNVTRANGRAAGGRTGSLTADAGGPSSSEPQRPRTRPRVMFKIPDAPSQGAAATPSLRPRPKVMFPIPRALRRRSVSQTTVRNGPSRQGSKTPGYDRVPTRNQYDRVPTRPQYDRVPAQVVYSALPSAPSTDAGAPRSRRQGLRTWGRQLNADAADLTAGLDVPAPPPRAVAPAAASAQASRTPRERATRTGSAATPAVGPAPTAPPVPSAPANWNGAGGRVQTDQARRARPQPSALGSSWQHSIESFFLKGP